MVLALDVSGSVNQTEFTQQVQGFALALDDPQARAIILHATETPVALAVFEWSSRNHQHVIQPWVYLDSAAALDSAILRIGSHTKVRAGLKTALGGFDEITVNALVVGDPSVASREGLGVSPAELRSYFEVEVIRGPGSFAVVSRGYADFTRAMRTKLMREISVPVFGQAGSGRRRGLRIADNCHITCR
ncbi:MAG: hypothetical protein ACI8Z0_000968 [Lentimonas sp.]